MQLHRSARRRTARLLLRLAAGSSAAAAWVAGPTGFGLYAKEAAWCERKALEFELRAHRADPTLPADIAALLGSGELVATNGKDVS